MIKIIPLSEGVFNIDANHQLREITNLDNPNIKTSLIIGINPFLIQRSNENILFDSGLGRKNAQGILDIHQHLYQHKLSPYDIHKVILSHLHHDHVKGIAYLNDLNQYQLSFPIATYYIHQDDFECTLQSTNVEEDVKQKLTFLKNETDALKFFNGQEGIIEQDILFLKTNAHCKHHVVFWISDDEQTIFYGADDAPQLIQMQRKIIAKYDEDGIACATLRQLWWQEGETNKWTFLFYHDTHTPIFSF